MKTRIELAQEAVSALSELVIGSRVEFAHMCWGRPCSAEEAASAKKTKQVIDIAAEALDKRHLSETHRKISEDMFLEATDAANKSPHKKEASEYFSKKMGPVFDRIRLKM